MKLIQKIFFIMFFMAEAFASDFRIISPDESTTFSRAQLLSHPALEHISIDNDRAYPNRIMEHDAIPLCKLLAPYHIQKNDIIELIAKDDFHVYVPASKIMDCRKKSSIAMLAIEPQSKWPIINNNTGTTAGPYEIIWLHPERSYISNEYWAWSVIELKITHEIDYKNVFPPPKSNNQNTIRGYEIYISHCEGCHTINHAGKAKIGYDLNCPKNPLEYYPDVNVLKQFIREPTSVRVLPNGRMSGSDFVSLSESDLDDLIDFFYYIKIRKNCIRSG